MSPVLLASRIMQTLLLSLACWVALVWLVMLGLSAAPAYAKQIVCGPSLPTMTAHLAQRWNERSLAHQVTPTGGVVILYGSDTGSYTILVRPAPSKPGYCVVGSGRSIRLASRLGGRI